MRQMDANVLQTDPMVRSLMKCRPVQTKTSKQVMASAVKTKIVEAATTELAKKAIALLLLLLTTLAVALVPQVRDRVLPLCRANVLRRSGADSATANGVRQQLQ